MKKSIAFLSFLMISVSGLRAQGDLTPVRLTALKQPIIIYTTKEVKVKFDKQNFLDTYASMESGVWVERNGREHKSATAAIEWLKSQKKPVQLDENMTDQAKPETSLVWLVQNLVGAPLMMKGQAEVIELSGNQKKEIVNVIVEESELSGKSYTFSFPSRSESFLKIWNVNEFVAFTQEVAPMEETTIVEIGSDDVMFEEPVPETVEPDDASRVYTITEIQPEYPGGMGKWTDYVKESLKYPKDAAKQNIEGTVFVSFVVQETGKLTDFSVIKGISPSCDKEALRLCQNSIDWKPGKQAGRTVKVRFVMPIKFKLAELEKK